MDKKDQKSLKLRYLVWLYKNTKEALDKTDRKFTQLEIDRFILKELKKACKDKRLLPQVAEFEEYIRVKEKDAANLKYPFGQLNPDYSFLALKLRAVEKAISAEFGRAVLAQTKATYEKEMLRRIMEERQEKR